MNKLTALSKLASAYHDQYAQISQHISSTIAAKDALEILEFRFQYIRRSLRIEDLKPQPKQTAEGLNPAGPKFF